jgi:hypothetical protein
MPQSPILVIVFIIPATALIEAKTALIEIKPREKMSRPEFP